MTSDPGAADCSRQPFAFRFAACAFAFLLAVPAVSAAQPPDVKPGEARPSETYQTLYLSNVMQTRDANDLVTDLRNMLPRARLYYVQSQNAISIRGSAEDVQLAQKILSELDRPRKAYLITYSIVEIENSTSVGTRSVSLVVQEGGSTDLKQGTRVPIVTGTYDSDATRANTQVQYIDIGLNIQASLEASPDGVRLRTRVEQSSVADDKPVASAQDPVIRQTTLEGVSSLRAGKPLSLGTMGVPGTNRRQEIDVLAEPVS